MFTKFLEDYKKSNKIIRRNTKLKPEDVRQMKQMLKRGVKQNVIAKLFAISEMQVTRIKRNENWAAIDE
jgi:DNA invertase Pin-like site-specific DNA recombinase